MSTVQLKNSLTRFHKIAERATEAITERVQAITALAAGRTCAADDFESAAEKARKDLEKIARYEAERSALSSAVTAIRSALAVANAQHGISEMLCKIEGERRDCAALTVIASAHFDDLEAAAKAASKRIEAVKEILASGDPNAFSASRLERVKGVSFSVVSEERRERATEEIRVAKLRIVGLTDKLAETNATQITVAVDAAAARILGLA